MILLVNGPNLNLLGEREPEVYGKTTLQEIEEMVRQACSGWNVGETSFQSNHEGKLIDGTGTHIVVVKVDPGYAPDPFNHGTGTIVAQYC